MRQGSTVSRSWVGGVFTRFRRSGVPSVSVRGAVQARRPGQSAVEAALTAAISIMTILVTLQLSLVAAQAFSADHVARSTARWLAVRMDTIDSAVQAQAATTGSNLPGMTGATVTVSPSCAALTGTPGICSGRDTGQAITVTVTTSLASVMFLPTSFGVSPFIFRLPSSMPAVAYTVLLE